MPTKINTPPIGLQDLLGTQSFGSNPSELLLSVRPIVDLFPFLVADQLAQERAAANIAGAGQTMAIAQPQGTLWIPQILTVGIQGHQDVGTEWGAFFEVANSGFAPGANTAKLWGTDHVLSSVEVGEETYVSYSFEQIFPVRGPASWQCSISPYLAGTGGDAFEFLWVGYQLDL